MQTRLIDVNDPRVINVCTAADFSLGYYDPRYYEAVTAKQVSQRCHNVVYWRAELEELKLRYKTSYVPATAVSSTLSW